MRGGITCNGKEVRGLQPVVSLRRCNSGPREADLNHRESSSVFFADLALKQDDFGSILPEYSAGGVSMKRNENGRTWPAIISGEQISN